MKQHFDRDHLPGDDLFHLFAKRGITKLYRVNGPFSCDTVDGNRVNCSDGWLAIDSEGYPYPVADSVFKASYGPTVSDARLRVALLDLIEAADGVLDNGHIDAVAALGDAVDRAEAVLKP